MALLAAGGAGGPPGGASIKGEGREAARGPVPVLVLGVTWGPAWDVSAPGASQICVDCAPKTPGQTLPLPCGPIGGHRQQPGAPVGVAHNHSGRGLAQRGGGCLKDSSPDQVRAPAPGRQSKTGESNITEAGVAFTPSAAGGA